MMIKYLYSVCIFLSLGCTASTTSHETNLAWLDKYSTEIHKAIKHTDDFNLTPILNTLISIWIDRDGGTTAEVSPLLITALIKHPDPMLIRLAEHPDSFKRWLAQFEGLIFTDFSGHDKEALEKRHAELTLAMEVCKSSCNEAVKPYARMIREQLAITVVRSID